MYTKDTFKMIPKKRLLIYMVLLVVFLVIFFTLHSLTLKPLPPSYHIEQAKGLDDTNLSFGDTLRKMFPPNSTIILALVDTAFVDMALNFYSTSLKAFSIDNFLFVGATKQACNELFSHNLPCYAYANVDTNGKASAFQTLEFNEKMNIRTDMIIDAMLLGYTVVHTDLDMTFLQNPLPDLATLHTDLTTMWDNVVYNAGFLIVRPTKAGLWIYQRVRAITQKSLKIDDQKALNKAIKECSKFEPPCVVSSLPTNAYMCGLYYFETAKRYFGVPSPCPECMVVHNNWIVTKEAKVYRFKENLMWWDDVDGYYSSQDVHYLTYKNPVVFKDKGNTLLQETIALKNALRIGHILNRIVILPHFHCTDKKGNVEQCPLNSLYAINTFDSEFSMMYRESSFLRHPLVPESVKSSLSASYMIRFAPDNNIPRNNKTIIKYSKEKEGPSPKELMTWFEGEPSRVLMFDNLYHATHGFDESQDFVDFQAKIKRALKRSEYRQYNA